MYKLYHPADNHQNMSGIKKMTNIVFKCGQLIALQAAFCHFNHRCNLLPTLMVLLLFIHYNMQSRFTSL